MNLLLLSFIPSTLGHRYLKSTHSRNWVEEKDETCPLGYSGLLAWLQCTHYYHCVSGDVYGDPIACPPDALFSEELQFCDWDDNVECPSDTNPPPVSVPVPEPETPTTLQPTPAPFNPGEPTPSVGMTCPTGYSGLRAWMDCTQYYHCVLGTVTGEPLPCPQGTLFSEVLQICDWDYNVECPSDTTPPPASVPTPIPETPTTPQPTQGAEPTNDAYITWHNYYDGQPVTEVSCSDGENGLIEKYGYSTLDPLIPYVAATSNVMWNSPNCGNCYAVSANDKTVYVTAIDQCGKGPNGEMHFDMHPVAFQELFGSVDVGIGSASFNEVSVSFCKGNNPSS